MNSILSSVVVLVLLGVAGGCASNRGAEKADVARSAIEIGMTEREVEDLMRPVSRERAIDHDGDKTGMVYNTGDRFIFVDGRLQSHTRVRPW